MYKRLTRQEMAIADKSFEYQDKRSGEMNVSKGQCLGEPGWLPLGSWCERMRGLKSALWICTMQSGEKRPAKDTGN